MLARHRDTGAWAGQSMLCVNEFSPAEAFQEDTSVVRAHRGHGLGLLMKAAMLRWVGEERPEVGEVVTVIPNHACGCTNMHDEVAVHRRGRLVGFWPVSARGKIR